MGGDAAKNGVQLPEPLPKFLTVGEVATLLRLSKQTVYDFVSTRRIPYRKAGDRTLFDRDEIIEWTKCDNRPEPVSARRVIGQGGV